MWQKTNVAEAIGFIKHVRSAEGYDSTVRTPETYKGSKESGEGLIGKVDPNQVP